MKNQLFLIASFIVSLFISQNVYSTQYVINTAGNTFVPATLSINIGDTVIWNNTGGFHNVNATLATYTSNPEGFGNSVAGPGWSFQWIFTIAGTYDYQCDPHAGIGMNGVITVNNAQPPALTYIPDDNFETALIALGLDTFPLNDSINTAAIDTVKSLYVNSMSIYDLTGIEGFTELEELDCSINSLYNIDVQFNLMLKELYIIGNPISAINLDNNINLTYLHIGATAIDYLDLSDNINLEWFNANFSSLDTLIFGNKPSLNYITVTNNNLNTLDASGCSSLSYLLVNNNNLESLNFQNGSNTGLTLYNSLYNPNLSCIQVDDANYSTTNWTNIDYSSSFSDNCSLLGCIDSLACNYNSLAWIDDGSCVLPSDTNLNIVACDYYLAISDSITVSGLYNDTLVNQFGCDSIISVNVTINNSSVSTSFVTVCDDYTWNNTLYSLSGIYSWSGINIHGCDSTEILNLTIGVCGCTDSLAFNYNINATINDSSCIAIVYGCIDSSMFNYNLQANIDDGFCIPYLNGCTDTAAINYNSLANTNDGSCYSCIINVSNFYSLPSNLQFCDGFIYLTPTGITPYTYFWSNGSTSNINSNLCDDVYTYTVIDANGCGSSDTIVLTTRIGCTDPNSFNYDSTAIYNDGSCIASIYGCIDSTATNYNALANTDDGGCLYCDINISQLTIGSNSTGNCDGWVFVGANSSTLISYLLNNNPASSYNTGLCSGLHTISVQNANCSVDSTFLIGIAAYGCTDSSAFNFNSNANIDDGSCISVVNGCTDSTAFNYNSLANTNDGSCIPVVLGCTDTSAANYNPLANIDDNSCNMCVGNFVNIQIVTANYGSELAWELVDATGNIVASGGCQSFPGNCYSSNVTYDNWVCLPTGCYSLNLYDMFGDGWAGGVYSIIDVNSTIYGYGTLSTGSSSIITNIGIPYCSILGCTDPTATNYNALANTDDGSCYTIQCVEVLPYSDDFELGSSNYSITLSSGSNALSSANGYAAKDGNYGWHGEATSSWSGSTPSSGQNVFNNKAGNIATLNVCVDLDSGVYNPSDVYHLKFDLKQEYSYNANYSWFRLQADNTVISDNNGNAYFQPNTPTSDSWQEIIYDVTSYVSMGVTDFNFQTCNKYPYGSFNNGDNGYVDNVLIYKLIYGCTDSTMYNYNVLANTDNGTCVLFTYGCTDPSYCNYDSLATADNGSCAGLAGCMDLLYDEYNSLASCDDGSCLTLLGPNTCPNSSPSNAYISELIHDRARVNWDNMNAANCMVDQYRIRYREQGTSYWSSKTMSGSGLCLFGLNTTSKKILGLAASTTYEYYMKAWYCGGGQSNWSALQNFTTLDLCPNVINFTVSTPTNTKASFTWDTTAAYSFARIKLRPDTTNAIWTTAGGFGVFYPALSKSKNGLTPGQTYRASARTWCNPSGGAYRSANWTAPIFWTQPTTIRLEGGSAINNLTIYPNPSRDIFNVSFTSENIQDLKVRFMNVIGEELINDNLEQFIGEYTKQIDLTNNAKGIYFLEIETNDGIINKKLILQ